MVAELRRPSAKATVIRPPFAAPATTWLLVITCPLPSRTKPDPMDSEELPPTRMTTVLGRTAFATATVFIWAGAGGTGVLLGPGAVVAGAVVGPVVGVVVGAVVAGGAEVAG